MKQPIGTVLADVLEGLAMDVRGKAVEAELAREERRPGRDWNAINAMLKGDRQRQGGFNPCQSPTREGGPRLVWVKE